MPRNPSQPARPSVRPAISIGGPAQWLAGATGIEAVDEQLGTATAHTGILKPDARCFAGAVDGSPAATTRQQGVLSAPASPPAPTTDTSWFAGLTRASRDAHCPVPRFGAPLRGSNEFGAPSPWQRRRFREDPDKLVPT
jgi:hypothetical protein